MLICYLILKPPVLHSTPQKITNEKDQFIQGLHIVANLRSGDSSLLQQSSAFKKFIDELVFAIELNKVGEVYHDFEGGGFTSVICLSESHLSVHTWPNNNYVTFDVFLSNFSRDNGPKAKKIYAEVVKFFGATVLFENVIHR